MLKGMSGRSLLGGALAGALTGQTRPARKVRVGLSGFDGHPEEILRVLPDSPGIELAAVADDGSDPAARAQGLENPLAATATHYEALEDMLAHERLDVLALCNNDGRRAASGRACAARKSEGIGEK